MLQYELPFCACLVYLPGCQAKKHSFWPNPTYQGIRRVLWAKKMLLLALFQLAKTLFHFFGGGGPGCVLGGLGCICGESSTSFSTSTGICKQKVYQQVNSAACHVRFGEQDLKPYSTFQLLCKQMTQIIHRSYAGPHPWRHYALVEISPLKQGMHFWLLGGQQSFFFICYHAECDRKYLVSVRNIPGLPLCKEKIS